MSTLTMPFPNPHTGFHREFAWQEPRPSEPMHRPRHEPEKVALPSIRQAIPELHLRIQQDGATRTPSVTSPISGPSQVMTPPEYVHSPNQNKRRRLSFDDERDSERPSQIPRLYASPSRAYSRHQSPPLTHRPAPEPWNSSGRTSPYMKHGTLPSMVSPGAAEVRERMEPRLSLPSLPQLDFERNADQMPRMRSLSRDDYVQEHTRPPLGHPTGPPMETATPIYRQAGYDYAYHHPTRVQSLSLEDEKQELMRQTGLQMNQISNWFINARRRQLPTLINNATAESNAMAGRSSNGKVLPSTERVDFEHDSKRSSVPLSDGDGSNFDDVDMDMLSRRRSANMKRGSV
ncbi:hypothetical protein JX266_000836 [Neoarthrinium moseri]|nr:hypothetical protein JX266_000836 [Neoarthrinium moseri]